MEDFNSILGNEPIKNYFHSAIKHDRVSHAYIFEGEKGCGKKLLSSTFSKILQCESEDEKPCGKCSSCIQIEHRNHPDVIWVSHEKANVISVGEIRSQVVNTIDIRPYKGPYKIYIIDEAEKMRHEAQNAILKTIEEPPEYSIIFFLTTNRGIFLPTILSRCVSMSVKPVRTDLIRDYLMQEERIDRGLADFYAGFSMGNLGKAIAISKSAEFNEMKEQAFGLLGSIHELDSYELDEKSKQCKSYKNEISEYFDIMRMWFRDILILKSTKDSDRIIFQNAKMTLLQQEKKLPWEAISKIFDKIAECEIQIKFNVNFEAAMDVLFMDIHRMFQN